MRSITTEAHSTGEIRYSELGFDTFTSLEYMNSVSQNTEKLGEGRRADRRDPCGPRVYRKRGICIYEIRSGTRTVSNRKVIEDPAGTMSGITAESDALRI
jgi:hypothetical protein